MKFGCTRVVLLLGDYAFKFPQFHYEWRHFLQGLLANMQEVSFSKTNWPELCPVIWSIPGGWLVVMRRARPMTRQEFDAFDPDWLKRDNYHIPAEPKMDSFGWLDGRLVAVDYGN